MGWGDEVVAAGQAQRRYDADPSTRIAITDLTGKVRWHPIWDGNPILATPMDVANGEPVRFVMSAPNCRPYIVYPFSVDTGWTFNREFKCREHRARIYLTPSERWRGADALERYGSYVLIEPYTKHDNFRWPIARWAELVAACPDLTFVQHTHADSVLIPGVTHFEQATFREACGLLTAASAYVRSESGLCHAAAALGVPQVTLFGGCMDPEVMAGYPGQEVICDDGPESPCGSWKPCRHCVDAMDRIDVADVVAALRRVLRRH